jgi:hypothetical protein
MLRRSLALAGVVATLLVPGTATAGVRYFEGPVDPEGDVMFHVKFRDGRARKVKAFSWMRVPAECDAGRTSVDGHFDFPMWVRDGAFHGKGVVRNGKGDSIGAAKVTGELRSRTKAVGTIRVSGLVPGLGTHCETHALDWSAFRT